MKIKKRFYPGVVLWILSGTIACNAPRQSSDIPKAPEQAYNVGYSDMMAIHSHSQEPELAWDYVEEYITGAFQSSDYVLRTGRGILEEKIQGSVGTEARTFEGVLPQITQRQADKVWDAVMEGVYYSGDNKPLLDIIAEETAPYFRGEKGLEEVTAIIQSRIQIYLDERE